MTPTLARMVAAHERNYKKPIKWYAIPQLFRFERQQKGRLKHFQFNADIIGESDPACHAAAGRTRRNAPLYGPPGHAYVYFNYGMHYLVNSVTEALGRPAAVLIRALDPWEGIDLMRRRRARRSARAPQAFGTHELCRGPGNLTRALAFGPRQNRVSLTGGRLHIEDLGFDPGPVAWSPRIGIRVGTERPWRAFLKGHPAVSGPRDRP